MSCEEVTRRLSDADGRVRAPARHPAPTCAPARIAGPSARRSTERRHDLASLAPLPAIASAGILHAVRGRRTRRGRRRGCAASTVARRRGQGRRRPRSSSSRSATVAVAATVGVSAADRSGLVEVGLPDGSSDAVTREATPEETGVAAGAFGAGKSRPTGSPAGRAGAGRRVVRAAGRRADRHRAGRRRGMPVELRRGDRRRPGTSPAAAHGQQTAAEHRAERGSRAKGTQPLPESEPAHSHRRRLASLNGAPGKPQKESDRAGTGHAQAQPGGEKPQGSVYAASGRFRNRRPQRKDRPRPSAISPVAGYWPLTRSPIFRSGDSIRTTRNRSTGCRRRHDEAYE